MSSAIIFDIDGVLRRGSSPIEQAEKAFANWKNNNYKMRHVFVTNGGGMKESEKAHHVTEYVNFPVDESKIIEGHTPAMDYVEQYRDKRVLLVGSEKSADVARSYGYKDVVSLDAYVKQHPYLVPYSCRYKNGQNPEIAKRDGSERIVMDKDSVPISLVLVFNVDDEYWKDALQVCLDVLMSVDGIPGHVPSSYKSFTQSVKIVISNPDLTYADKFCAPRVTEGSFRLCLQTLYKEFTGLDLVYTQLGKPHLATYAFALKRLAAQDKDMPITRVYGIGDNPRSDIRGINSRKADMPHIEWVSILVRTGCFQGGDNDETDPADVVCADVFEALAYIWQREGMTEVQYK